MANFRYWGVLAMVVVVASVQAVPVQNPTEDASTTTLPPTSRQNNWSSALSSLIKDQMGAVLRDYLRRVLLPGPVVVSNTTAADSNDKQAPEMFLQPPLPEADEYPQQRAEIPEANDDDNMVDVTGIVSSNTYPLRRVHNHQQTYQQPERFIYSNLGKMRPPLEDDGDAGHQQQMRPSEANLQHQQHQQRPSEANLQHQQRPSEVNLQQQHQLRPESMVLAPSQVGLFLRSARAPPASLIQQREMDKNYQRYLHTAVEGYLDYN